MITLSYGKNNSFKNNIVLLQRIDKVNLFGLYKFKLIIATGNLSVSFLVFVPIILLNINKIHHYEKKILLISISKTIIFLSIIYS